MPHAHRLIMKKGKEEQDDPHDLVIGPELEYKAWWVLIFDVFPNQLFYTVYRSYITE